MITIELRDDGVLAVLGRLDATLTDLSPVMNDIGQYLARSAKDRISAGVTPEGTPFAPRSEVTLARYAKLGRAYGGVLHYSGDMRENIFHTYGPDRAEVGSNAVQAAVMQFGQAKGASGTTARGGPIPWGDIPARPFLGISEEDRSAIGDIVSEWLDEAAAGR